MSKKNRIQVSCPNCSQEQSVIVWESLNVTLNPEAKRDLLENRINTLVCSECGLESQLAAELLYHDMEKGFCALYFPFEAVDKGALFTKFNRHGDLVGCSGGFSDDREKPYDYMKDIHVVFNITELIRYVVFRDKLHRSHSAMDDFSRPLFNPQAEDAKG